MGDNYDEIFQNEVGGTISVLPFIRYHMLCTDHSLNLFFSSFFFFVLLNDRGCTVIFP